MNLFAHRKVAAYDGEAPKQQGCHLGSVAIQTPPSAILQEELVRGYLAPQKRVGAKYLDTQPHGHLKGA